MTWKVLLQAFGCGALGGALGQNILMECLKLTSVTNVSAMINLVPAFTFIVAVPLRLESLELGSVAGKAKVVGTLTGLGGAMILIFVKGPEINIFTTHMNLLNLSQPHDHREDTHSDHVLGTSLAVLASLFYALWLILQKKMAQIYPCHYSSTALMCVMAMVQGLATAFFFERDRNQWKLGWNIRLFTVAYAGIVGSGIAIVLATYCTHLRGPVFVSSFNPLMVVVVAIAGSLVLSEKLHLGSIIGTLLIVCGLYMVLWGKNKEMRQHQTVAPSDSIKDVEASPIDEGDDATPSHGSRKAKDPNKNEPPKCFDKIYWCLH